MALVKAANVGSADRILRIVLGLIAAGTGYAFNSAPWSIIAYVVAVVLIVTAVVRFCPAYRILGTSSCRT